MTWQEKVLALHKGGKTLEWIADRVGANYITVYKWSRGETQPLETFRKKINELLKYEGIRDDIPTSA